MSRRSAEGANADAPLADLPLRDGPAAPAPHRELFEPGAAVTAHKGAALVWFVAAGALVVGVIIGFSSGYAAGKRATAAAELRMFSEATVPGPAPAAPEPIAVEPEPIAVEREAAAAPEPPAAEPAPPPPVAPRPAPRTEPRAPAVAAVASGPGSLEILSRPAGAQVILDGRVVGRTPLTIPNVAPGVHSVRLELPTYNRWATDVEVSPGARTRVSGSLEQP